MLPESSGRCSGLPRYQVVEEFRHVRYEVGHLGQAVHNSDRPSFQNLTPANL